ncbi:uncharacterized protein B0I36DRAFT_331862 [Microdochium trichocladiopsis]|uniref:Uncharacterized protein n=1 Tax=Microdochium trichocladiopsis TaxID=1682393 RepID=A0A9P9BL93_9PEZI|nr:uncharacterized protein B0I36DRAFT_331862 [Microdochium trichocladiopsis]KAH7024687.1 hypothetical protein B0I36DRAFT_331862 [Microdochium trichocladiopsis]
MIGSKSMLGPKNALTMHEVSAGCMEVEFCKYTFITRAGLEPRSNRRPHRIPAHPCHRCHEQCKGSTETDTHHYRRYRSYRQTRLIRQYAS